MQHIDPRKTALDILVKVQSRRLPLDLVIEDFRNTITQMDPKDRRLMNAIVYGVLRWRNRLDRVIAESSRTPLKKIDPKVRDILRIAIFQLIYLDRVPDSAAIHTAVELSKAFGKGNVAGFVNGVLRNAQENWRKVYDPPKNIPVVEQIAWQHALPIWMAERWVNRFGPKRAMDLATSLNRIPPITMRVNTLRTSTDRLLEEMKDRVGQIEANPWLPDALDFSHPDGAIDRLPGFRDGMFQIQDAAAQLVGHLLAPRPGERVLDACAGYGGKTGHIAQLMENKGELIAADVSGNKLFRLQHEMQRLGITMVKTEVGDLSDPEKVTRLGRFDRILVDAPCSGMGVIRRNPDIKWVRDRDGFGKFSDRQFRLIDALCRQLRPGGLLVFAVCSTEPEETTEVVEAFTAAHPEMKVESPGTKFPESAAPFVTETGCLLPWQHSFHVDGFFAVAFRKSGRRKVVG